MLITFGTDSLLSEICKRDLFHRDFTLGNHSTCYYMAIGQVSNEVMNNLKLQCIQSQ